MSFLALLLFSVFPIIIRSSNPSRITFFNNHKTNDTDFTSKIPFVQLSEQQSFIFYHDQAYVSRLGLLVFNEELSGLYVVAAETLKYEIVLRTLTYRDVEFDKYSFYFDEEESYVYTYTRKCPLGSTNDGKCDFKFWRMKNDGRKEGDAFELVFEYKNFPSKPDDMVISDDVMIICMPSQRYPDINSRTMCLRYDIAKNLTKWILNGTIRIVDGDYVPIDTLVMFEKQVMIPTNDNIFGYDITTDKLNEMWNCMEFEKRDQCAPYFFFVVREKEMYFSSSLQEKYPSMIFTYRFNGSGFETIDHLLESGKFDKTDTFLYTFSDSTFGQFYSVNGYNITEDPIKQEGIYENAYYEECRSSFITETNELYFAIYFSTETTSYKTVETTFWKTQALDIPHQEIVTVPFLDIRDWCSTKGVIYIVGDTSRDDSTNQEDVDYYLYRVNTETRSFDKLWKICTHNDDKGIYCHAGLECVGFGEAVLFSYGDYKGSQNRTELFSILP